MGIPVVRVGDIGVGVCSIGADCCPHTYTFIVMNSGSMTYANNLEVATIGTTGSATCPHCSSGVIISGSNTVLAKNLGVARVGDTHSLPCGSGALISGSPNVFLT